MVGTGLNLRLQAGDLLRDPVRLAREAGFDVVHCERRAGRRGVPGPGRQTARRQLT